MAKQFFSILFIMSNIVCVMCYKLNNRKKSDMHKSLRNLILISGIVTTTYTFTLIFNSYLLMKIAYSIYFALMDWLCAAMFLFIMDFTGYISRWRKYGFYFLPILIIDSLSQILNFFFNQALIYKINIYHGSTYFKLQPKMPFRIHLLICYILIGASLLILIYRIIKSSKIYRRQYEVILFLIGMFVLVDGVFLKSRINIDFSIIGYSVTICIISYYILDHMPGQLKLKMLGIMADSIDSAFIIFDRYGTIAFENMKGKSLGNGTDINIEDVFDELGLKSGDEVKPFRNELTIKNDSKKHIFDIQYNIISENMGQEGSRSIGSYLIMRDITEDRRRLLLREYYATHHELTGVYNKSFFCERAQDMVRENVDKEYAVILTDIYQFKIYNEVLGKDAGNHILCRMGRILSDRLKDKDIVYGYYSGDRFAVCMPYDKYEIEDLEKYISMELSQAGGFEVVNYIGVCMVDNVFDPISILCERAALAINTIKGDASHRIAYYNNNMMEELIREKKLISDFPQAMENGDIRVYIQPQFNQMTGKLVGGEILSRWITKDGNVISPGEFIPVLEKNGLITKLDTYMWEEACKIASNFKIEGLPVALSVNLSAQDFFKSDLYETFTGLIKKYNLPPEYLKLEITESEIMTDLDKTIVLIKKLQDRGFIVEMDDFGSGYSSLNTLQDMPIDVVKLDMNFLKDDAHKEKSRKIMTSIVSLAHELGLSVIVEGVERIEQAEFLKSIGCIYVQGYLYGKPMPVEEFIKLRKDNEYESIKTNKL